jgi:hypothetical protein
VVLEGTPGGCCCGGEAGFETVREGLGMGSLFGIPPCVVRSGNAAYGIYLVFGVGSCYGTRLASHCMENGVFFLVFCRIDGYSQSVGTLRMLAQSS